MPRQLLLVLCDIPSCEMGMLSYFVVATATGADGTAADPDSLVIAASALSAASLALNDDYKSKPKVEYSLTEVGYFLSPSKLYAYVTPGNCRTWSQLLRDLHAAFPTLTLRLHYWYEEKMMTFLQVTPAGATSMHCVHGATCTCKDCCGHECCAVVPYFVTTANLALHIGKARDFTTCAKAGNFAGLCRPEYLDHTVIGASRVFDLVVAYMEKKARDGSAAYHVEPDDWEIENEVWFVNTAEYVRAVDDPAICKLVSCDLAVVASRSNLLGW